MIGTILTYEDISFLYNEYLKAEDFGLFLQKTDGLFRINKLELEMIWQAFDKVSEYHHRKQWWSDSW